MALAPQITFRNMESSSRLEEAVLREATRLERFFPRTVSCRVAIEGPPRAEFGGLYRVRIELGVPGEELVVEHIRTLHKTLRAEEAVHVTKGSEPDRGRRDAQLAVREAFHEMRRRLQDYARRMRGDTKRHERWPKGHVIRLSPEDGFGFIDAAGREVYFHRNSVLGGHFGRLRIGSRVRFAEEMGEKGPRATTVSLIRSARQGREAATNRLIPTFAKG
jgi:cold shock CspA family protein